MNLQAVACLHRRHTAAMTAIAMTAMCCASTTAQPQGPDRPMPGAASGQRFLDLAGKDAPFVEINIEGPLLAALAKSFAAEDRQLAAFLKDVRRIHSLVIELPDALRRAAAEDAAVAFEAELKESGWQRLAYIREPDFHSRALIHGADDRIDGLAVVTLEADRVIFSNIAGRIDLATLARLSTTLSIPGLKSIPVDSQPATRPAAPTTRPAGPPSSAPAKRSNDKGSGS